MRQGFPFASPALVVCSSGSSMQGSPCYSLEEPVRFTEERSDVAVICKGKQMLLNYILEQGGQVTEYEF
jgi:hypothetical protein